MNFRNIFTTLACIFLAFSASAQDKIFKKNGETIEAKISLINAEIIVFKRFDNPDGPEYTINKAEVAKIKYANGSQDIFEENNDRIGVAKGKENERPTNEESVNRNIAAFAPLVFTEHGYGIAVNWEHTLDKAGWISVNLPLILTWNFADAGVQKDALVYFMPGIKVYPNLSASTRNKFSIGPSLVMAVGQGTPSQRYNVTAVDPEPHQSHVMMGGMAVIGANIFPTANTYMGGEFGIGYSYFNQYNNTSDITSVLTHLSLKFGYRYKSKLKKH